MPALDLLILDLHRALEITSFWEACCRLLENEFTHHILTGGFCFETNTPALILRSANAPEHDADWWQRNGEAHPFMRRVAADPTLLITRVSDMMSEEEVKASAYYREFVEPEGWLYSVGMFFRGDADQRLIGMLAVNRRPDQGDFTDREMRRFAELYPHFDVAFSRLLNVSKVNLHLHPMASVWLDAPEALAMVSLEGQLLFLNHAGREMCARWKDPGLFAEVELVEDDHNPLQEPIFLLRFRNKTGSETKQPLCPDSLALLTPAEEKVAKQAVQGLSNKEIAVALGKSPSTVKTQLESIYRKTGVHGRGALFRLLMNDHVDGNNPAH